MVACSIRSLVNVKSLQLSVVRSVLTYGRDNDMEGERSRIRAGYQNG